MSIRARLDERQEEDSAAPPERIKSAACKTAQHVKGLIKVVGT